MTKTKLPQKGDKLKTPKEVGEHKCSCCGVVYNRQQNNFFKSNSPLYVNNNKFTNHCRNCVNEYYKKLLGFYNGDAEKAMRHVCGLYDIYYNESIFSTTGKEATDSRVLLYINKLNLSQFKASEKTFLDTLSENQNKPQVAESDEAIEEDIYRASPEIIRFWGEGFSNEVYGNLQYAYDDWVERNGGEENISKTQELILKQICILELKVHELNLAGDTKGVVSLTKTIQDLIKTGEFKPTPRKDRSDSNMMCAMWAQFIENNRPIDEKPRTEWVDIDGIHKLHDKMAGSLHRTFNLKNYNSETFGEFIAENSIDMSDEDIGGFADD